MCHSTVGCKQTLLPYASFSFSDLMFALAAMQGVVNMLQKGVKKISPFFIPYAITNMGGALLAIDQVRMRWQSQCSVLS